MNDDRASEKVIVPLWCCDAFVNAVGGLDGDTSSGEHLSRIECFAEAVLTYDKVVVPARYLEYEEFTAAFGDDVFLPLSEEDLIHSWDMSSGLTFTRSAIGMVDELSAENGHWNKQINPTLHDMVSEQGWDAPGDFHIPVLRLWQKQSVLEACAYHQADCLFPPSLRFAVTDQRKPAFVTSGIDRLRGYAKARIVDLDLEVRVDRLLANANDAPVFLALALARAKSVSELPQALCSLRRDLGSLRKLRQSVKSTIGGGKTMGDMSRSLTSYRTALDSLLEDKEVTSFWGRKVTIEEISSSVIDAVTSPWETLTKVVIPHYLKSKEEKRERRILSGMVDLKLMIDRLCIQEPYMKKMGKREIL